MNNLLDIITEARDWNEVANAHERAGENIPDGDDLVDRVDAHESAAVDIDREGVVLLRRVLKSRAALVHLSELVAEYDDTQSSYELCEQFADAVRELVR